MQVSSTSASRSAQSVPACGQAVRMADWGSHSAGKRRLESDMETFCMHSCTQRCRQGYWVDPPPRMAGLGPTSFAAALCAPASMTRLISSTEERLVVNARVCTSRFERAAELEKKK